MDKSVVVSITSYPARIDSAAMVIERLSQQTMQPDKIVLYISSDRFEEEAAELPLELKRLEQQKRVCIAWRKQDLGPHTKYFYAFQDFPDSLIITIDDDLIYPNDMIETLVKSYERFPYAVSALRNHLMTFQFDGAFRSYSDWFMEFDGLLQKPTMRLFATGVGGVLYPAWLFHDYPFDADEVMQLSPMADDLLLKAAETILNVPVVQPEAHWKLEYLPDTQNCGLFHTNVDENKNDLQWERIVDYVKSHHGIDLNVKIVGHTFESDDNSTELEACISYLVDSKKEEHARLLQTKKELKELNKEINAARKQLKTAERDIALLQQRIDEILQSHSWRIGQAATKPYDMIQKIIGKR